MKTIKVTFEVSVERTPNDVTEEYFKKDISRMLHVDEDYKIINEVIQNYESGFLPSVIERDRIVKTLKSLKNRKESNMKELTIEQKAKAYDEALERAKEMIKAMITIGGVAKVDDIQHIFPELKESEDDKIKRFLLESFKSLSKACPKGYYRDDITYKDIVDWLEKQGESDETKAKVFLINKGYPIDTNGVFPTYEEMYNIIREGLEKQGEQKPVDKVEHKFEIGDWVVFNNKHQSIYQIEKIEDGYYILRHTHGGTFRVCVLHDESLRLWTIQDAKAGDVLACNEEILLFKSYSVQGRISLYCWYNGQTNNFHSKEVDDTLLTTRNKICPATKEQCDLLFQKMKEAGYEWNAEEKELKKIDKEVNDEVKPKFKFGDRVRNKKSGLEQILGSCIGDIYEGAFPFHIGDQDDWELVEQKPAEWSDDESKQQINPSEYINDMGGNGCYLKNTAQTSAWSEKDKDAIEMGIIALEDMYDPDEPDNTYGGYTIPFDEAAKRLKSLRPQRNVGYNPYKATVESITKMVEKYESIISNKVDAVDFLNEVRAKCNEAKQYDVKYPQKQWKPSEEQMAALLVAVGDEKKLGSNAYKELYELFLQLKQL